MKNKQDISILLVDDDSFVRSFMVELLSSSPDINIVGEAENGREAIDKIRQLKPDLVTMDINMPEMGGLDAIEHIMQSNALPILVITDQSDAQIAFSAISRGALEVLPKPDLDSFNSDAFQQKIRMLAQVKVVRHIRRTSVSATSAAGSNDSVPVRQAENGAIAIAVSTGGPRTLQALFSGLPSPLRMPILIAQHIAEGFDRGLVEWLSKHTPMRVKIAEHGEVPLPGVVYFSPSECHMTVAKNQKLSLQRRESTDIFVPSGNLLLASVGKVFGKSAKGVVLTGMGDDGTAGIREIKTAGGETIAQDQTSSVIYGMPKSAIESGYIDRVMSIEDIVKWLKNLTTQKEL